MDKIKQIIINESHKRLDVDWVVELWGRDKIETKKMIQEAIVRGDLVGVVEERSENFDDGFKEVTSKNRMAKINNGWLGDNYCRFIVDRDDFTAWLKKSKQWPISNETSLYQWLNGIQALKPLKAEQRINFIIETLQGLNYDPKNILEGGKAKCEKVCLENSLFTESTFKSAWQEANKNDLIRMNEKEKYL